MEILPSHQGVRSGFALLALVASSVLAPAHAQSAPQDIQVALVLQTDQQVIARSVSSDVNFSSDGQTLTSAAILNQDSPNTAYYLFCLKTNMNQITVTASTSNGVANGFPVLVDSASDAIINYDLRGFVSGEADFISPQAFNAAQSHLFDVAGEALGLGDCSANEYQFAFTITPDMTPADPTQSVQETLAGSNLDDGRPHTFTDVITATFAPGLK